MATPIKAIPQDIEYFLNQYGEKWAEPLASAFQNWQNSIDKTKQSAINLKNKESQYNGFMQSIKKTQDVFGTAENAIIANYITAKNLHDTALAEEIEIKRIYSNLLTDATRSKFPIIIPLLTGLTAGVVSALIMHFCLNSFFGEGK